LFSDLSGKIKSTPTPYRIQVPAQLPTPVHDPITPKNTSGTLQLPQLPFTTAMPGQVSYLTSHLTLYCPQHRLVPQQHFENSKSHCLHLSDDPLLALFTRLRLRSKVVNLAFA